MKYCDYCKSANKEDRERCHSCGATFTKNEVLESYKEMGSTSPIELRTALDFISNTITQDQKKCIDRFMLDEGFNKIVENYLLRKDLKNIENLNKENASELIDIMVQRLLKMRF